MYTGFAVVAEFVRDLILGMVAGLMTTISMSLNGGDQEAQWRLRALSAWMQHKQLPKSFQMPMKEYCHELWSNRTSLDTEALFDDIPPHMRDQLTHLLYGPTLSSNPLFRGLSNEVMTALCNYARPMYVLPKQDVIQEGRPGNEMYMILSGEFEVLQGLTHKGGLLNKAKQHHSVVRLGYLSEGSFFGEAAILNGSNASEPRTRTVRAVTDSELCYLTSDDLEHMKSDYPELRARMNRFEKAGARPVKKIQSKMSTLSTLKKPPHMVAPESGIARAVRNALPTPPTMPRLSTRTLASVPRHHHDAGAEVNVSAGAAGAEPTEPSLSSSAAVVAAVSDAVATAVHGQMEAAERRLISGLIGALRAERLIATEARSSLRTEDDASGASPS